ncbi:MAG: T9SS type A sorting domain-containing protein [Bacteroidales bacterium]|nr:T9SS type A sorting domain-containing protein [Bacteroidales bacterium]
MKKQIKICIFFAYCMFLLSGNTMGQLTAYYDTNKPDANNEGTITVHAVQGTTPYTYLWSTGSTTSSITYTTQQPYSVTITDNNSATKVLTIQPESDIYTPIEWTNLNNVSVDGYKLTSTGPQSNWDVKANSANILDRYQNGFIEYTITPENYTAHQTGYSKFWFGDGNMAYGFYFYNGDLRIFDFGDQVTGITFTIGDVFQIKHENDKYIYKKNGVVLRTLTGRPVDKQLSIGITLVTIGSTINKVYASFATPVFRALPEVIKNCQQGTETAYLNVTGGVPPYTYQWNTGATSSTISATSITGYSYTVTDAKANTITGTNSNPVKTYDIMWTDKVYATEEGNILKATAYGSSGAASINTLAGGQDGYVEYIIQPNDYNNYYTPRAFGLSDQNVNEFKNTIDYGFYITDTYLQVIENGGSKIGNVSYQRGDILQIAREGDNIVYKKNGVTLRTVGTEKAKDLLVDVSFDHKSIFTHIKSSFCIAPLKISYNTNKNCGSTTGTINAIPSSGIQPYSYLWNTGETTSQITTSAVSCTVTVTDGWGNSASQTISMLEPVIWDQLQGAQFQNETITRTAPGQGWDSKSFSANHLEKTQDGFVELMITPEIYNKYINKNHFIRFGLQAEGGWMYSFAIKQNAFMVHTNQYNVDNIPFSIGDKFRISKQNDKVYFTKNDVLLWESSTFYKLSMRVMVDLYSAGSSLSNLKASFCPMPLSSYPDVVKNNDAESGIIYTNACNGVRPYSYLWNTGETTSTVAFTDDNDYAVTITDNSGASIVKTIETFLYSANRIMWKDKVNVEENNEAIYNTNYAAWGTIGAASVNVLPANQDGYMEYVFGPEDYYRPIGYVFGLSSVNANASYVSINYGFIFSVYNYYKVIENNGPKTPEVTPQLGDIFRIERIGSTIYYKKNGVLLYSTPTDPNNNLMVDISLSGGMQITRLKTGYNPIKKELREMSCSIPETGANCNLIYNGNFDIVNGNEPLLNGFLLKNSFELNNVPGWKRFVGTPEMLPSYVNASNYKINGNTARITSIMNSQGIDKIQSIITHANVEPQSNYIINFTYIVQGKNSPTGIQNTGSIQVGFIDNTSWLNVCEYVKQQELNALPNPILAMVPPFNLFSSNQEFTSKVLEFPSNVQTFTTPIQEFTQCIKPSSNWEYMYIMPRQLTEGAMDVYIDDIKLIPVKLTPDQTINCGESATLEIECLSEILQYAHNISYLWSTGATTPNINVSPIQTTNYTLNITFQDNDGVTHSCINLETTVIVKPIEFIVSSQNYCGSECNGKGIVTPLISTIDYIYNWSNGEYTKDVNNLCAGTYNVIVSTNNGCSSNKTIVITEAPALSIDFSVINPTCSGLCNGEVTATFSGGTAPYNYTYEYLYANSGLVVSHSGTTSNYHHLTNLCSGNYSVAVTDANGCAVSGSTNITEPEAISFNLISVNPCSGACNGSLKVETITGGTPPYSILWSNNATTYEINALCAGNYFVVVTDANGCTLTKTSTLTIQEGCENISSLIAICDTLNPGYVIVNATQTITNDCGFYWKVEEIYASGATIDGTVMDNPSNWWEYSIREDHNFPGYYGNSNTTTGNGIFLGGHTYKFTHCVWSACSPWNCTEQVMTMPLCNGMKTIKYENNHMVQSETANSVSNNESMNLIFSVFPNPTTGRFYVNVGNYNNEEYKIQVMDIMGRTIYEGKEQAAQKEIDLSNQPKGMYFVRLIADGKVYTEKIVRQ